MTSTIASIRTSPNAVADGRFDPILLGDLITWASYDQDTISLDDYMREHYADWGSWDQGVWARTEVENPSCKSAFCMAGQAVSQAGFTMLDEGDRTRFDVDNYATFDNCAPIVGVQRDPVTNKITAHLYDEKKIESISSVGRRVIGLDNIEAGYFFDGDNDLGTLIALADWFCRRRGEVLPVKPGVLDGAAGWIADEAAWEKVLNDGYPWFEDDDE